MATNEKRFVVTGEQSLRLGNASAELNRQLYLQRDTKLNPEHVIATLQGMTEGKLAPFTGGLRGRFIRTMPIQIGGVPKDELLEQVRAVRSIYPYAESMMKHKSFTTLGEQELAILIDLSPADLGFTENPTTDEFLDEERLAQWSAANLDSYIVELCPAEVGPHFAIQYKNQPKGEVLWIAMKRLPDSVGYPHVFHVERYDDGELWLGGGWADPGGRWSLGGRVLFRLRKAS